MSSTRIVERVHVDGDKEFVIQQRHFIFKWWWVDAWVNSPNGASCNDSFDTLEEAKRNLCYFDGSVSTDVVVLDVTNIV